MSKLFHRNAIIAYVLILSIVLWSWLLLTIGATAIVDWIGAENGYWVMFLVALLGGISSLGGVTYVATIVTLASGGLNPLGLAIASGLAISIGDSAYYYIGRYGLRTITLSKAAHKLQKVTQWLDARSRQALFIFIYCYTAFTPLPNDILTITLGVTRQPWLISILALVAGNMTLTFLIAEFGSALPFLL